MIEKWYYIGFEDKLGMLNLLKHPVPDTEVERFFRYIKRLDIAVKVVRVEVGNVEELIDDEQTKDNTETSEHNKE